MNTIKRACLGLMMIAMLGNFGCPPPKDLKEELDVTVQDAGRTLGAQFRMISQSLFGQ
jgi:hypothetical protein